MDILRKNILVTGLPGVGKTTLIKCLARASKDLHPVGFYTEEIREGDVRRGFELVSLNGRRGLLSHINIRSSRRVGKYKVDIKAFEDFLGTIPFLSPSTCLIVIDEIGKMECHSETFRELLHKILDSEKWVIATIALKGSGFIEEIKRRHDMKLFELTRNNRDSLLSDILGEVGMAY